MSQYKALITDLDGTSVGLSSDGSDVNEITRISIAEAQKQGYMITCATGRSWNLAKPVIERLGITEACIIEGGTRIIDPTTGISLWEKHLGKSAVSKILEIFKQETGDGTLLTHDEEMHKPLKEVTVAPRIARVMYLLGIDSKPATSICNLINEQGVAAAHPTLSWSGRGKVDVHVTHIEATKEHAVQVWQGLQGITKEETIGMGDSGNDIPLFQSVGLKIAVGNATPELKQLADYIAPNHDEDALVHVIDHFILCK